VGHQLTSVMFVPGKWQVDYSPGVPAGIAEHHLMSVILFPGAAVPICLYWLASTTLSTFMLYCTAVRVKSKSGSMAELPRWQRAKASAGYCEGNAHVVIVHFTAHLKFSDWSMWLKNRPRGALSHAPGVSYLQVGTSLQFLGIIPLEVVQSHIPNALESR
jgi:hypothetical protein